MLSKQAFAAEKRALFSSAIPQAMNKKSNSVYIVDPNGPHFPLKLISPRKLCSHGPSLDHGHTPPPMKFTDREAAPSPEHFSMYTLQDSPIPAALPISTHLYTCNSRWNPENTNLFTHLEELLDFDNPALAKKANHYNIVVVETAPNTPPSSPGPSDSLLQESTAPGDHSSMISGINQSVAACNSASQATYGEANEKACTSGAPCPAFPIFEPNLKNISGSMYDSPLVGPSNQSEQPHASMAATPATGTNNMACGSAAPALSFLNKGGNLVNISNQCGDSPFVVDSYGNVNQLANRVNGSSGFAPEISLKISDDDNNAYPKKKQDNLNSCSNMKAGSNLKSFSINPKVDNVVTTNSSKEFEFKNLYADIDTNAGNINYNLICNNVTKLTEHIHSNPRFLNFNPASNLAGVGQERIINNHTNLDWFSHDPNLDVHNGSEFYSSEPMETENMPNAHPPNGKHFGYLNSPMETDTPSGVPNISNQPMDEENTPKEIADIEASIAALNQRD
ncbi:hypothetical protein DSO57_1013996 [Entomophthora muscae]|uniref:Uncharacterized protein n=1 Tax=Entomophthora muscae TaxID=34485 RepID=A0ACC2TTA5_9FUNG|nr:hypothetical protein DSO57_1013996 [Entomophthora muscae]